MSATPLTPPPVSSAQALPLAASQTTQQSSSEQVALMFLELARNEIVERIKFLDQISVLWIGGVAAVVGWTYKEAKNDQHFIFYLGAVVGFLALAVSWIRRHNEAMVNALARYQKEELAKHFAVIAPGVTLWECSDYLKTSDTKFSVVMTSILQAAMVIGPNIFLIIATVAKGMLKQADWPEWSSLIAEIVLTTGALFFTIQMIVERSDLRNT